MTKPRSKSPLVTPAQRVAINRGLQAVGEIADTIYRTGLRKVAKGASAAARAGLKGNAKSK